MMMLKRWHGFVVLALLLGASAASALSLGRVRGSALIGRGFDVNVLSSLEAQESTPDANCFSVDLFYGDTRVSPNSVNVSVDRSAGGELRIRVRSSAVVDEPVVTLFVRASCGAAVSRRYVLLSETLTDAETSGAPAALPILIAPAPATSPRVGPAAAPSARQEGAAVNPVSSAASGRQARRQAREQAAQERAQQRAAQKRPAQAVAEPGVSEISRQARNSVVRKAEKVKEGAPRLQVDLLDLSPTDPVLRGTAELISAPSGDENVRRQAQALWRSLNASPEESLRESQRLEALETQMRTALEQSKRQNQDIAALSAELEVAKRSRYLNPLTLFLGLLTLAAVGMSLWLWRRQASTGPAWWNSKSANAPQDEAHLWGHLADSQMSPIAAKTGAPDAVAVKKSGEFQSTGQQTAQSTSASTAPDTRPGVLAGSGSQGPLRFVNPPPAQVDFTQPSEKFSLSTAKITPLGTSGGQGRGGSMGRVDSTPPPSLMDTASGMRSPEPGRTFAPSEFGNSMFSSPRVVAAEELFDIQEQADFFLSLGQPDQAIEVLKNHITDNVETSALAYMDLFDIYHRTQREEDYSSLREEFNRVFNAQVPEFSRYGIVSVGLEGFPKILKRIQDGWHKPQEALELIEESIFRQPDQDQPPMDMLAYRELMLLYSMAKEITRMPKAGFIAPRAAAAADAGQAAIANNGTGISPDLDLPLDFNADDKPKAELLSQEQDATVSLPPSLSLNAQALNDQNSSLDFDLSGMDDLKPVSDDTFPGLKKKS